MYKKRAVRDKNGRVIHEVSRLQPMHGDVCMGPWGHATCTCTSSGHQLMRQMQLYALLVMLDPKPYRHLPSPDVCVLIVCFYLQDLQSKELPSTRIQPDRRWFGNTRVIGQKQLEQFRSEMSTKVNDAYTVLLKEKKLPLQLLEDPEKKLKGKQVRRVGPFLIMLELNGSRISAAAPLPPFRSHAANFCMLLFVVALMLIVFVRRHCRFATT